jgi:hypothetical protein
VRSSELVVGDPARRRAGTAILAALTLVSVFASASWFTKETSYLDLRQPWQDDPYDVLVSLDFVVLPVLVLLGAARTQLCRRYSSLPSRRIVDLLRVCGAAVGACLMTQAAEWIAVALGLHHASWDAATLWQVIALLVGTLGMTVAAAGLHAASRAVRQVSRPGPQPDWLTDLVALGLRTSEKSGRYGPYASRSLRWIDVRILARTRERPVRAAVLVAAVLALPFVAAKVVLEGYPPALVLFSFLLPAMALFALIVIAGRYLRVIAPRSDTRPMGVTAAVLACLSGPALFAFHDFLLPRGQTIAGLYALLLGGAIIGGLTTLLTLHAMNRVQSNRT